MEEMNELLKECEEFLAEAPLEYGLELSVKDVSIVVEALKVQMFLQNLIRTLPEGTSGISIPIPFGKIVPVPGKLE